MAPKRPLTHPSSGSVDGSIVPDERFGQSGFAHEALVATDTNRYRLMNVAIGCDLDRSAIEFRARRQDAHIEAGAVHINKPHNRDHSCETIPAQFATPVDCEPSTAI